MEPETEPLDWGNEDEEQQALRRASHDYATRPDPRVAEDVEDDTISLGDEEEQGYYYQHDIASKDAYYANNTSKDILERPPSPQRRASPMGANDQQRSQHDYRGGDNFEGASYPSNMSADSPPRHHNSRNQNTPPRPNTTRLKHALPPKPVPAMVPYLPPSHPSIVSATSMTEISPRAASNDTKKTNGANGKLDLSPTPGDLPYPWERRRARTGGDKYYYNKETHDSTWTLPTSRSNRDHSHVRADPDIDDPPRGQAGNYRDRDLSYRDRHYKPGGELPASTPDVHPVVRSEAVGSQYPRSRFERSPAVSPHRQRRRPRSTTPPRIRTGQDHPRNHDFGPSRRHEHVSRERHGYTNPDSPVPRDVRDVEMLPPDHWVQPDMPSEYGITERFSRKPPPRGIDDRDLDHPSYKPSNRPPMNRRPESNRGATRDRETPRRPDMREHPTGNPGFQSASRYPPRERDSGHDYPSYREPISAPGPPPPSDRNDRPRFERTVSANGHPHNVGPPERESYIQRGRDYDARPPSDNRPPPESRPLLDNRPSPNYDHRRGGERGRRDLTPESHSRRVDNRHPGGERFEHGRRAVTPEPPPVRHVEHPQPGPQRSNRYPDQYDRPPPEEAPLTHRRRAPLPSQGTTFLSSGPSSGMQGRDPPPHVAMDYAPKSQGWANDDPNLPRQPKYQGNPKPVPIERERERPQPPTPSYAQDYRNNGPGPRSQDRGRPDYPSQMPPKLDTRMDVDPRDLVNTRHALSPRSARNQRGRMDDIDSLPEGPRSARPLQERQERPYHAPAPPVAPPLNPRYENVPPSGFQPPPPPPPPPPRRSGYQGERFNDNRDTRDNRSGWRDNQRDKQRENQPRVGYPDRNNPPPRRDFRGRPDDGGRPPAVSGANTMPIGSRKVPPPDVPTGPPSLPPNGFPMPPPAAFGFNPDARPPSSTLINPVKAQALELNTRIPNRPAFDQPRSAHPPESAKLAAPPALPDQQLTINTETEKSKRRVSRFSPLIPKVNEQQERIVQPPSNAVAAEELDRGHATPPPISRNSSTISFKEHGSAQPSVHGRSSSSPRTPPPVPSDRHEERSFSSRFSDEVSREDLSRRMSSTRDTLSPTSPRMAGSEQGADLPASLSRRMIGEKPPRHRKYSSQFKVPEDLVQAEVTIATEYVQVVQDNSLKDRLDSANSQRRGSLLDRLSLGNDNAHSAADSSDVQPQSLRDRLVPSKRDRDDMMEANDQGPAYDAEDGNDNKRVKRRATKGKRGGRR